MGEPRRLNLSPLFVALLGVMIGAIILTIYHCVIVGWCNRSRALSRRQQAPPGLRPDRDETPSSLEHSRVDLLPVKKYTKEGKTVGIDEDEAMCSVCLAEFKEGDELRVLPDCDHSFHIECIDMWLSSHSSCPLCRTDATPLLNRTDTTSTRQHEIDITVPPPQHSINSNTRPVQTVWLSADEAPIGTTFYN